MRGSSPRPFPPHFLPQSRFLMPNGGKPRELSGPSLPRPHLPPAPGWYLSRPLLSAPFRFRLSGLWVPEGYCCGGRDGKVRFSYPEGHCQQDQIQGPSEAALVLPDVPEAVSGRGLCKVDETPKGWYIQYIDRDPETIRRQLELEKKKKQDLDDEEKTAKFIEEQVRRGLEGKEQEAPVFTELSRENDEEKVAFNLNKGACSSTATSSKSSSLGPSALKVIEATASVKRKEPSHSSAQPKEKKKKKSALDEIMEIEEEKKRAARTDYWLQPEIIVKIITKKLGEKYHKKKGIVKEVIDKYTAVVKMIDSGDKLKLDQTHLETVIPAPGKRILVLNGGYRGNEAILESINEKTFSATIVIETGPLKGRRVEGIQYEDISKLA
ncbi:DNA/RNA-binding protein KIN17 isoform X4 [Pipistrellus kuhlii]|uniref:DNA/RNA-binding protein KIN17 isoform X4 n=1 Tax=Pipistrellus kuhlii TaxID=59472 RepID=UPI00174F1334|nr:DNA/RNA-binding protein KIN17 isoform X4 [Pipistrellus kuhlii]